MAYCIIRYPRDRLGHETHVSEIGGCHVILAEGVPTLRRKVAIVLLPIPRGAEPFVESAGIDPLLQRNEHARGKLQ